MHELVEQARGEVEQIRELIDEVLFLSELESGTRVVSLGAEPVLPVLREVVSELEETAARAGVRISAQGDEDATAEVRPRMLRVVARNLAENAIRYAGPGSNATLSVVREADGVVISVADDGAGVVGGRPAAPLRALLPRRSLARLARDGARARDREAHRRLGRRDGRGARGPRARARGALRVSRALVPLFHQTLLPEERGDLTSQRLRSSR